MNVWNNLKGHEQEHGRFAIAVVGAGYVASGVVHILDQMPAVRPAIIVNRTLDNAVKAYTDLGIDEADIVISDTPSVLADAIANCKPAVTEHFEALAELPLHAVVEATGALEYGTRTILFALDHGFDVISFNAEVDTLLGWLFHDRARSAGVVYTIADGDQPGAQFRLAEQVESMGFEVTTLLNCKRHLNVHQNPSSGENFSKRDTTSAIMTTSFGDGTKMQIEQAVVANARGAVPAVRGMHGVRTTQQDALADFGAVMPDEGHHVDFTLGGDFGAGVAVIARHPKRTLHAKALTLYKMGDGPDYFFFRPFHLVHLELPMTIAQVLIDGEPLARVVEPHVSRVIAMAKKDLASGEKLDCIGGYTAYGLLDAAERALDCLPIGLVEFATPTRPFAVDAPIRLDDVELDRSKDVVKEWLALQKRWSRL